MFGHEPHALMTCHDLAIHSEADMFGRRARIMEPVHAPEVVGT